MRGRTIAVLAILLVALASTTTFEARQNGLGSGDNGCSCHGVMTGNTVITVEGLPDVFNTSEEYMITVTISNDDVPVANPDQNGGFRIVTSGGGQLESVPDINGNVANEDEGGLTHTMEINDRRTWEFKWTAPADDTAIVEFTIWGNAVNGNGAADSNGDDQWNRKDISVLGLNDNPAASSAAALTILITAIGLSLGLILVGSMWVFNTRNPDTFSIGSFWASGATTVIALRGWHPALSRAEAEAMFPECEIERTDARRLITTNGSSDWTRSNQMSGCECVLVDGGITKWTSLEDLLELIDCQKMDEMAVECWRHEGKLPISTKDVEMQVGGLFHDKGSTFNLEKPKHRFGVVLDASAQYVAWGWMIGPGPGKHGWSAMSANKRPFFRPVSLEPRLARAAVNIAAGINEGYVIDPMCGTGGILIESAITGRKTLGIDFDPVMVDGTKQNLQWAGVEAEVKRDDATRFELPNDIAAIVVDPPYGRNSIGDEKLLEEMLENISSQIDECNLVVILPCEAGNENLDEDIDFQFELPGFTIKQTFGIPVHKSLGRVLITASISPQD